MNSLFSSRDWVYLSSHLMKIAALRPGWKNRADEMAAIIPLAQKNYKVLQ